LEIVHRAAPYRNVPVTFALDLMKRASLALFLSLVAGIATGGEVEIAYPILAIPKSTNSDALLGYKLTDRERSLFKEMDAEAGKLPASANLPAYHEVAIRVGKKYGLSAIQAVAFFTRTTFSEFEQ
jgi:hypothetical protein